MLKEFEDSLDIIYNRSSDIVTSCENAINGIRSNSPEKAIGFIGHAKGKSDEIYHKSIKDMVTYYKADSTRITSWAENNMIHPCHKEIYQKYISKKSL